MTKAIQVTPSTKIEFLDLKGDFTESVKLNFSTGKIDQFTKEIIIVGIPYKDRIELNTKKFIEFQQIVFKVGIIRLPDTIS